ncbi:MAG: hypothetical protein WB421_16155 [Terriglobales bacterium]
MNHTEVTYYVNETPQNATIQLESNGATITLQDKPKAGMQLCVFVAAADVKKFVDLWNKIKLSDQTHIFGT